MDSRSYMYLFAGSMLGSAFVLFGIAIMINMAMAKGHSSRMQNIEDCLRHEYCYLNPDDMEYMRAVGEAL